MLTDRIELLKAGIAGGQFPKKLFKYRTISERTEHMFENNELWFSSPDKFNDPFDFKIVDKGKYSKTDVMAYLIKKGDEKSQAETLADAAIKNASSLETIIEETKSNVLNKKGVLCLSKIRDNILMWSHYADEHKGFVLGFELEEDLGFFMLPLNVRYSEKYPSIAYLKNDQELVNSCIRTKHIGWSYEEEVRIVKSTASAYKFNKKALSEVIFGCRMTEKDRSFIIKLLTKHDYTGTQCYQAKTSKYDYKIEVEKIK